MVDSVEKCLQVSGYSNSYQKGKDAIEKKHRGKVRIKNPHNLKGSMDIEAQIGARQEIPRPY